MPTPQYKIKSLTTTTITPPCPESRLTISELDEMTSVATAVSVTHRRLDKETAEEEPGRSCVLTTRGREDAWLPGRPPARRRDWTQISRFWRCLENTPWGGGLRVAETHPPCLCPLCLNASSALPPTTESFPQTSLFVGIYFYLPVKSCLRKRHRQKIPPAYFAPHEWQHKRRGARRDG